MSAQRGRNNSQSVTIATETSDCMHHWTVEPPAGINDQGPPGVLDTQLLLKVSVHIPNCADVQFRVSLWGLVSIIVGPMWVGA